MENCQVHGLRTPLPDIMTIKIPMSHSDLTVVIPFYQRTPEPLVRAINSIKVQQGVECPQVLIVDDESPVSARSILDQYVPDHGAFIQLIEQKNKGAAGARNTALDHLPESTQYVAFLDSDDEWTPHHLDHALRVLSRGYDFYFANHQRPDWSQDRFTQMGLSRERHRCFDPERQLYEFVGDVLLPVMGQQMVKTSSVVYRRTALPEVRFPEHLILGEDDVFWLRALRSVRQAGFCFQVEVEMGEGVNISQGGGWGELRSFKLMIENLQKWRSLPQLFPDEAALPKLCRENIQKIRQDFAVGVLHRLRRGNGLPMEYWARYTRMDPSWILALLNQILRKFEGKS